MKVLCKMVECWFLELLQPWTCDDVPDPQAYNKIWAAFTDLSHLNSHMIECNGSSSYHLKIQRHIDYQEARTKIWAAFTDLGHLNSRMIECNRSSWCHLKIRRHIYDLQAHNKNLGSIYRLEPIKFMYDWMWRRLMISFEDIKAHNKIWAAFTDFGHLNLRMIECNGGSWYHSKIQRHIDDPQAHNKIWAVFRDLAHLNSHVRIECYGSSWYYLMIRRHIVNSQARTKIWAAFRYLAHLNSHMIEYNGSSWYYSKIRRDMTKFWQHLLKPFKLAHDRI